MSDLELKRSEYLPILDAITIAMDSIKEGRETPFVIVDASNRQDFITNSMMHTRDGLPGDMICIWSWPKEKKYPPSAMLTIEFKKPIHHTIRLVFDIETYGEIIDSILLSKCLTILHGKSDIVTLIKENAPGVTIEIPPTASFPVWDEIYLEGLTNRYKSQGFKEKIAVKKAKEQIKKYRREWILKIRADNRYELKLSDLA